MAAAWWAGVRVAGRVSDPATLLETEAALEPETSLSTEQPRRNARSENIFFGKMKKAQNLQKIDNYGKGF